MKLSLKTYLKDQLMLQCTSTENYLNLIYPINKMAQICIDIPDELKQQAEESNLDLSNSIKQFIALKVFEKQLSESTELQRAVFEFLASKSKLTEEGAKELADQVKEGMWKEFKKAFPDS